jgi:hypothetical protein
MVFGNAALAQRNRSAKLRQSPMRRLPMVAQASWRRITGLPEAAPSERTSPMPGNQDRSAAELHRAVRTLVGPLDLEADPTRVRPSKPLSGRLRMSPCDLHDGQSTRSLVRAKLA